MGKGVMVAPSIFSELKYMEIHWGGTWIERNKLQFAVRDHREKAVASCGDRLASMAFGTLDTGKCTDKHDTLFSAIWTPIR